MEKTIILGKKEYKYKVNFKLSYDFLKYRNRITKGFDFSNGDKEVVKEVITMQNKLQAKQQEAQKEGKVLNEEDLSFLNELSPEALNFLAESNNKDLFNYEEIIEIVSKFTQIEDKDKILEILDEEVEENGFDNLVSKLTLAISEVFTNAKVNL